MVLNEQMGYKYTHICNVFTAMRYEVYGGLEFQSW